MKREGLRLDKWLWAARFYKTRVLAADAVNGGKVHLNGERSKAGKLIYPGDQLKIRRGHYEFIVTVEQLDKQRRSAGNAAHLYCESEASINARQAMQLQLKAQVGYSPRSSARPDKQTRKRLIAMKKGTD